MSYPTFRRWLGWRWRRYGFSFWRLEILPGRVYWLGPVHTYLLRFEKRVRDNW